MIVDLETLGTVNRCSVSEMEKVGRLLNPKEPDACERFGGHVKKLEAALIHTYGLIAYVAVYQKNPGEAANLWKQMAGFCEIALRVLRDMKERFLLCGTPEVYDLALDYKLISDEKYQQNLRDSECLNLKINKNLLEERGVASEADPH